MQDTTKIQELLPHTGSMFLLDAICHFDREGIECRAVSHRDLANPLRHAGQLPAHVGIEYAAQAAGLHGGLLNRLGNPEATPQRGYIAVLSQVTWQVNRLDDLAGELRIFAQRIAVAAGGRLYRCRIEHNDAIILSGDLVIALELR